MGWVILIGTGDAGLGAGELWICSGAVCFGAGELWLCVGDACLGVEKTCLGTGDVLHCAGEDWSSFGEGG